MDLEGHSVPGTGLGLKSESLEIEVEKVEKKRNPPNPNFPPNSLNIPMHFENLSILKK